MTKKPTPKKKNICENCSHFGPEMTKLNEYNDPEKFPIKKDTKEADCHLLPQRNLVVGPAGAKVISMPSQTPRTYWCHYFKARPVKPKTIPKTKKT